MAEDELIRQLREVMSDALRTGRLHSIAHLSPVLHNGIVYRNLDTATLAITGSPWLPEPDKPRPKPRPVEPWYPPPWTPPPLLMTTHDPSFGGPV